MACWAPPRVVEVDLLAGDRLDHVGAGDEQMCWCRSTWKTKSVMAGEYTAPPAHGPMITEICGMTPEACTLRRKIRP